MRPREPGPWGMLVDLVRLPVPPKREVGSKKGDAAPPSPCRPCRHCVGKSPTFGAVWVTVECRTSVGKWQENPLFTCVNVVQKRLSALAAPQGFEPRYADPESAVLPLNEGAVILGWSQPIAGPF